jgi:peptide deformylase
MTKLVNQNHPALHSISEELSMEDFDNGVVTKILKDLRKAIKTYNVEGFAAVAIAAPQIGVAKRMFLVEDQSGAEEERFPTLVAVNPKIIKTSKKTHEVGEGCLSVPKDYGIVKRHVNVTLRALDENGKEYERGAGGLLAQIIQHECDHLDGILFIDRAIKTWPVDKKPAHLSEAGNEPEDE